MRVEQLLNEEVLFESSLLTEHRAVYNEWKNAGKIIVEANLTIDQINQIFNTIADPSAAGGPYRVQNALGKTASSINQAYQGIINSISNLKPIKNFDDKFDSVMEKLKNTSGGAEIAKAVYWYRNFAKKYPVTQNVIYTGLIATVGLATGGAAPIVALGAMKLVDRLLQGDRFSQAAIKAGVTAGAAALIRNIATDHAQSGSSTQPVQNPNDAYTPPSDAAQPGDLTRPIVNPNDAFTPPAEPTPNPRLGDLPSSSGLGPSGMSSYTVQGGDTLSDLAKQYQVSVNDLVKANPALQADPDYLPKGATLKIPAPTGNDIYQYGVGTADDTAKRIAAAGGEAAARKAVRKGLGLESIDRDATIAAWTLSEDLYQARSVVIREEALPLLWEAIEEAGFMDYIKKAGRAVAGGIEKVGGMVGRPIEKGWRAISTKELTGPKLMKAWANGPGYAYSGRTRGADSSTVIRFLLDQGVDKNTIAAAFQKLGIPMYKGGDSATPTSTPSSAPAATASPSTSTKTAPTAAPKTAGQSSGIESYLQKWAADIRGVPSTRPNDKIALAREMINFLRDRRGSPEANRATTQARAVVQRDPYIPATQKAQLLAALPKMESKIFKFINQVFESVGITWEKLGFSIITESNNYYALPSNKIGLYEAVSAAQQAAIAINMKKRGKKPKKHENR